MVCVMAVATAVSLWDAAVRYTCEALGSAQPAYPPNLAGKVLAIAYRDISEDSGPGSRTPAQLRADLERLLAGGYFPVNLRDVVEGKLNMVPAGKRPIVLTFDDSTPSQLPAPAAGWFGRARHGSRNSAGFSCSPPCRLAAEGHLLRAGQCCRPGSWASRSSALPS